MQRGSRARSELGVLEPMDVSLPAVCRSPLRCRRSQTWIWSSWFPSAAASTRSQPTKCEEILEENTARFYTQIKIDEITNLGAVKIRLRSLFAAAEEQEEEHRD